jgi:hypothetical protein
METEFLSYGLVERQSVLCCATSGLGQSLC